MSSGDIISPSEASVAAYDLLFDEAGQVNPDSLSGLESEALELHLSTAEKRLAIAGAELALNFHTSDEKDIFRARLAEYLSLQKAKTVLDLADKLAITNDPNTAARNAIDNLVRSERRVLRTDVDYRLASSKLERFKERFADSKLKRQAGKVALYGGQGAAFYLVGKGFMQNGSSTHNVLLAASAAGAQVTGRAFGQELARQGNLQLEAYTPLGCSPDEDNTENIGKCDPLARHEAHIAITRASLFEQASEHSLGSESAREEFTNDITTRLGHWLELYYNQPTLKDRLTLFMWGGAAVITAGLTVVQI